MRRAYGLNQSGLSRFKLVCAVLILLSTIGYGFSVGSYARHVSFLVHNDAVLQMSAARGETFALDIQVDDASTGDWASDGGLELRLDGVSSPLTVVSPRQKYWNETIESQGAANSALLVTGSVTIPTSVAGPEQRELSGQITGSLLYPSPQQGYNFTDKTAQIYIPVQLHLVPQATLLWSWNQFSWQLSFFVALVGSVALIGVILRGVLQAYRGQKKRPEITDQVWAWGGGLVLASIVVLILWAVFDALARAGIAGSLPGDISFRDLFLPCMVGASGMVTLVSLVY